MNIKPLTLTAVSLAILSGCGSESYSDHKDKSMASFLKLSQPARKEVVTGYLNQENIKDKKESFYSCVSQMAFTKSQSIPLSIVMGWCKNDYHQGTLSQYTNFDSFEKGFSSWDGSYRELEKLVKHRMNDPKSYEHIRTTYRFELNSQKPAIAIIKTEFRGKNQFGSIALDQVMASIDVKTGAVIELM